MEFCEELEIKEYKTGRGVYFLMNEDSDVIYIGSSVVDYNIRIASHRDKQYSFYSVLDMTPHSDQEILDMEAKMIVKYKPRHNKSLPFNTIWRRLPDSKKKRDRAISKVNKPNIETITTNHYLKR